MRAHLVTSQCLAKFKPIPTGDSILSKTRENVSLIAVEFGSCRYIGILFSPPWAECLRSHCYVLIEYGFLLFVCWFWVFLFFIMTVPVRQEYINHLYENHPAVDPNIYRESSIPDQIPQVLCKPSRLGPAVVNLIFQTKKYAH